MSHVGGFISGDCLGYHAPTSIAFTVPMEISGESSEVLLDSGDNVKLGRSRLENTSTLVLNPSPSCWVRKEAKIAEQHNLFASCSLYEPTAVYLRVLFFCEKTRLS